MFYTSTIHYKLKVPFENLNNRFFDFIEIDITQVEFLAGQ